MNQGPMIVFVCEHGAAKSVVAAAHFNNLARETGLPYRAIARATHPEQELAQKAVMGLLADGLHPPESKPRGLAAKDIANARMVISFCELPGVYPHTTSIEQWDDVPPVSEDYEQAREAILAHIRQLLEKL